MCRITRASWRTFTKDSIFFYTTLLAAMILIAGFSLMMHAVKESELTDTISSLFLYGGICLAISIFLFCIVFARGVILYRRYRQRRLMRKRLTTAQATLVVVNRTGLQLVDLATSSRWVDDDTPAPNPDLGTGPNPNDPQEGISNLVSLGETQVGPIRRTIASVEI